MTSQIIAKGNEWHIIVEDTPAGAGTSEPYCVFCRTFLK